MKKIISCVIAILFCCESLSFANYDGYKSYLKGLLALKKAKTDVAISEFERTLSYDTQATTVYKDLALIYMQQGNNNVTHLMYLKLGSPTPGLWPVRNWAIQQEVSSK